MSAVSEPAWLFLHADQNHLDRTCLVDELSGGQFVLVNEAVNLGIAIYNMRQGEGIRYETLFRDETVGALDAANGKEYVRMLRRAMDLGGFHQVIFICNTPLVSELANQVLIVGGGNVCVGDAGAATTESPQPARPSNPLFSPNPQASRGCNDYSISMAPATLAW